MIHTIDLVFQGLPGNIAAFLVETPAGPALVETGPHSTLARLRDGLQAHGVQAEDVRHVFLTHIHLDHAGAAWWFARQGATIYVHPRGSRHLAGPERLMESARRIYQDKMDELWGEMHPIPTRRIQEVEHEGEIALGGESFRAYHTPGHATHHIAWRFGDALFTGDVAGVRIGAGIVVPPCPPPDIQVEDWLESTALIRSLGVRRLYLTHFGEHTDVDAHLDALDQRLQAWAQWIKPYYDAGTEHGELTELFQTVVRNTLEESGLSEFSIRQYEAANPSWMSVAGLLRYWKKKEERKAS